MTDTLLGKLMDRIVQRISSRQMRPVFYEILAALDECYVLIDVSGDDGGQWLYLVWDGTLQEKPLMELESALFRERHFTILIPDWTLYDILLKQMTPIEASAYASWGGTEAAHPSWVYLRSAKFFELLQAAVDLG